MPFTAGIRAAAVVRQMVAERIVNLLGRHDPALLDGMTEVGVINRDWVENPAEAPISTATPFEVLERLLERTVERRPSMLASLGLSAIEVLAAGGGADGDPAKATSDLTVVFTDLEGFTRFTAQHGDAEATRLLKEHYRTAGPIVRSRGGRIVKRLGDGLLITFLEPTAAVLATLELTEAPPEPLKVRAGLHHGPVIAQRADVVGHVVNVAARVAETAHGGEVLVTSELCEAIGDEIPGVRFGRLRRRRLKGVDERVPVRPVWRDG